MRMQKSPRAVARRRVRALVSADGLTHRRRTLVGVPWPTAADAFLTSLTPEQRQQAVVSRSTRDERMHWHFIPTEMFPRKGLTIKEMTEPQRKLAHELLEAGLSQRGYLTATSIMDLENVLGALEAAQRAAGRAAAWTHAARSGALLLLRLRHAVGEGTPGAGAWKAITSRCTSPSSTARSSPARRRFFGSNPAEVREGPKKGLRILGAEEDAARALLDALDAAQRTKAVINPRRRTTSLTMNNVTSSRCRPPA